MRRRERYINKTARAVALLIFVSMTKDEGKIAGLIRCMDPGKGYHGNPETNTFSWFRVAFSVGGVFSNNNNNRIDQSSRLLYQRSFSSVKYHTFFFLMIERELMDINRYFQFPEPSSIIFFYMFCFWTSIKYFENNSIHFPNTQY